jgi:cytochrome c peroxidase
MQTQITKTLIISFLLLNGCGTNHSMDDNATIVSHTSLLDEGILLDKKLHQLIKIHKLTGDPSVGRDIPSINSPKAQLGKKLFYTKALSLNFDSACASCHHPYLGGGDALSLPIGTEAIDPDLLGPGRKHKEDGLGFFDGGPTVPRNAPTTFNISLADKAQFWDSRIESTTGTPLKNGSQGKLLVPEQSDHNRSAVGSEFADNLAAAQADFPIVSGAEMRGFAHNTLSSKAAVRQYLIERLSGTNNNTDLPQERLDSWLKAFRDGFNMPNSDASKLITATNIGNAIGEFERSQTFVNNPWKTYVEGDNMAISNKAKKGAILFLSKYEDGGANCIECHSGDKFTDEKLYVMAVPQIGRGKNEDNSTEDYGRSRITLNNKDIYKFRTMSLLNVEATGPWGHDGAYTTLRNMVRHMLEPEIAREYIPSEHLKQAGIEIQCKDVDQNTEHALEQLESNRQNGISPHTSVKMTDKQIDQIVAFLNTLTDPCVLDKECQSKWVPANPDSQENRLLNQLNAHFR